jgi:hypothetical protein
LNGDARRPEYDHLVFKQVMRRRGSTCAETEYGAALWCSATSRSWMSVRRPMSSSVGWSRRGNEREIGELGREAMDELRNATASLG